MNNILIKVLDSDKQTTDLLSKIKDYYIESDLATADKTIHFLVPKTLGNNIKQEQYLRTQSAEFVIKEINQSDYNYLEVFGKLNVEELEGKLYTSYESVEQPCHFVLDDILSITGWTYSMINPSTKKRTLRTDSDKTVRELITDCAKLYNVEIEFDSINKIVKVYDVIGVDRGAYVYSDLNLKQSEIQSDTYDYKTRLYAKGKDNLTFADINGGKDYVENFQYSSKIIEMSWSDDRYTVAQNLLEDAKLKLNELSKPRFAFTIDVINLVGVKPEYAILDFRLGDSVKVIDKHNELIDSQRIVHLTEYPITPEKNVAELSNTKITFVDANESTNNELEILNSNIIKNKTELDKAISNVTDLITNSENGFVIVRYNEDNKPYELLIMDTDSIATATNVWRWNMAGLGFSNSGYNGTYETAITNDGQIVANFITTGQLNANIIKSGILQSVNGNTFINMEDGTFNFADRIVFDGSAFKINLSGGKDLDEAIEDIDNKKNITVKVISSEGTALKGTIKQTTLSARVLNWNEDITDTIPYTNFNWKRQSLSKINDEYWNIEYGLGKKTITITTDDVFEQASFDCEVTVD